MVASCYYFTRGNEWLLVVTSGNEWLLVVTRGNE